MNLCDAKRDKLSNYSVRNWSNRNGALKKEV